MPDADATVYAKWTVNIHTVSYNMNGHGTQVASQSVNYGASIPQPNVDNVT